MRKRTLSIIFIISIALVTLSSSYAQPPGMMHGMGMGMTQEADTERLHNYGDTPLIYNLNNGMEIMLVENHSSPMIASVVVVRVGARDESVELNGATHYLEHLLFNGTETRTQKQLYDDMDFLGGYNNAHTAHDYTAFMILLEKSNFEKGLEIQADMLFHSVLPPDKLEKEKGIVTEEIGKDEDSESYRMERFFDSVLFRGTPYERPILGSRQSIGNMNREQVWGYYKNYYVPNNMAAMIIGDFHTPEMMDLLDSIFGAELPKALPQRPRLAPTQHVRDPHTWEALYLGQGEASSHKVRLSYHAPTRLHSEYSAFVVMTSLLQSYLDKEMTANPILGVSGVGVSHFTDVDFGIMSITLTLDPDVSYEPALEEVRTALVSFSEAKVDPEKIAAIVTSIRSQEIFNAERPHYYGMLKGEDLAQAGAHFLQRYPEFLGGVTAEDVELHKGTFSVEPSVIAVYEAVGNEKVESVEETAVRVTVPKELPNGLLAIVQEDRDNPIFAAHFLFKNRSAYEVELGGKPGMVDFMHHVFAYGPTDMEKDQFQTELDKYGAKVKFHDMGFIPYDDYYTTPEFSYIRVEVMDESYVPVLDLIARTLSDPSLDSETIEAVRGQMTGMAVRDQGSVSKSGRKLFKSIMHGDSPLAAEVIGNPADIASYTADELRTFSERYFHPGNLILTALSSHDAGTVHAEIEKAFSGWQSDLTLPEVTVSRPAASPQLVEESGGKEQSYLAMGYIFDLQDATDRAPLTILNAIISERLQFQLREKEGLAYTLGSSVSFHDSWGLWYARMGTGPQNLERAQEGIIEEMQKAATESYSEHDVTKARNAYLGRLAMRSLTRVSRAYLMGLGEMHGEGVEFHSRWLTQLRQVTNSDVDRAARLYLKADGMSRAIIR